MIQDPNYNLFNSRFFVLSRYRPKVRTLRILVHANSNNSFYHQETKSEDKKWLPKILLQKTRRIAISSTFRFEGNLIQNAEYTKRKSKSRRTEIIWLQSCHQIRPKSITEFRTENKVGITFHPTPEELSFVQFNKFNLSH